MKPADRRIADRRIADRRIADSALTAAGPGPGAPAAGVLTAIADAHRSDWAFVVAATTRITGDLGLAEECVQDAYAKALSTWEERGVPANPGAWLITVARNAALDVLRRKATAARALPKLLDERIEPGPGEVEAADIPDDRLRLIFTCCHPLLPVEAQVALTLRLLCGLTTVDVARAFLVGESTMAARITRAKQRIAAARIPYEVPPVDQLADRIDVVLTVVHLLFSTGHTAPVGANLVRPDLVESALDLARMLHALLPADAEVAGMLALILLTDARRETRVAEDGQVLLLADQDRTRWDQAAISAGVRLVTQALHRQPPGRFVLMAAIAAVHDEAPSWAATDWPEIVGLYDRLAVVWPSAVVGLNRAVAIGFARGPAAGLAALNGIADEPRLAGYGYLAAARADFLRRLGRTSEALSSYQEALVRTDNEVERAFLARRIEEIGEVGG